MRRAVAPLALALVLVAAPALRAIVYVAADFHTLVSEAGAIVVGRVVALQPQWTEGRHGIETLLSLEVEEYLKGNLGQSLVVRVPGGRMGPYLSVMPGAPRFAEGDEVVLFLAGPDSEVPHILGLGQGVFRILRDSSSGERTVVPELLISTGGEPVRVIRGDLTRRPTSFTRFAADVRGSTIPLRDRSRGPGRGVR